MSTRRIALPADSISLSAQMADRLLRCGSADAALLYLYLLRHDGFYDPDEAGRVLHWERVRLDGALMLLSELGVKTGEMPVTFTTSVPEKENAPEYSTQDLADALRQPDSDFPDLLEEVQRLFGRTLSNRDTRILLELYDYLGLPAEVLLIIVNWQCQEYADKYGSSRHPPMSFVRTAAYRWKEAGVDTLEAADAYLKKLTYYRSQEGTILAAMDIRGRKAIPTERKFINQWLEWGFSPETVAIAYEKTILATGERKWSYCNSILRRWHQENRHTPEEVRAAETRKARTSASTGPAPAKPVTPAQQEAQARALEENQRQLQRLLDSLD